MTDRRREEEKVSEAVNRLLDDQRIGTAGVGRVAPHDEDAEQSVLSAVLLDTTGAVLDEVRAVLDIADVFYTDRNRRIYEAVLELDRRNVRPDAVTVGQELESQKRLHQVGGTPYLVQLVHAMPHVANVREHALLVRSLYRRRRVIELARRKMIEAYGNVGDFDEWVGGYEAELSDIAHTTHSQGLVPFGEVAAEAVAQATNPMAQTGIDTGFKDLNGLMHYHPGDFVIIASRPGMGKTAFALTTAVKQARLGFGVAFFSLEMPAIQLAMRLLAAEARVSLARMREGKLNGNEVANLQQGLAALQNLPIWVDDTPAISVLEIRARVRRLQSEIHQGRHPTVTQGALANVFIDYLQLARPAGRQGRTREEDVASMSRDCKQTAKELDVPVTALCQLNREVEKRQDKRPQLADLRESGALEQDADDVLFVFRPGYYDRERSEPSLHGWAEIIVAKQRNGPPGMRRVAFDEDHVSFADLARAPTGNPMVNGVPLWKHEDDDFDDG